MCKHCKNNSFVSSVISPLLHDDESLFVPLPLLEMHHVAYVNSFHFDDMNFNGSFFLVFPDRAWRLLSPNLGLTCDHLKHWHYIASHPTASKKEDIAKPNHLKNRRKVKTFVIVSIRPSKVHVVITFSAEISLFCGSTVQTQIFILYTSY